MLSEAAMDTLAVAVVQLRLKIIDHIDIGPVRGVGFVLHVPGWTRSSYNTNFILLIFIDSFNWWGRRYHRLGRAEVW
ncbi:hypothetical protein V2G26_001942 [Clonostachys chloroleuca]